MCPETHVFCTYSQLSLTLTPFLFLLREYLIVSGPRCRAMVSDSVMLPHLLRLSFADMSTVVLQYCK